MMILSLMTNNHAFQSLFFLSLNSFLFADILRRFNCLIKLLYKLLSELLSELISIEFNVLWSFREL